MKISYLNKIPGNVETIIVPFLEDQIDLKQIKSSFNAEVKGLFKAKWKENLRLPGKSLKQQVYLFGLGKTEDQSRSHQAFRSFAHKNSGILSGNVAIDLRNLPVSYYYQATLGFELASYNAGIYKSNGNNEGLKDIKELQIIGEEPLKNAKQLIEKARLTADTQKRIMQLVDMPANYKTPKYLSTWAKASAKSYGYNATVLSGAQLNKNKLEALLAVGKGSENPPAFIILEYKPKGSKSKKPKLGLVGKGITFDTGGISIKASNNMHYMKSDMGGAAAVLGAIELAARLQLKIHLVAIVPTAENSVDAHSVKPGDVIGSFSGKTIEVIDTDAEGRLVLADGVAYMQKKFNPEIVIDLATLTGSSVMTFGYAAAALFSNNEELVKDLIHAGVKTHERMWQLPLWKDYESDIQSDIADVRNYSGRPLAGAITAAKFIEFFIKDHPKWAHLDIAGVAFGDSEFTKMKSASGYGVKMLIAFMEDQISS